MSYAVDLVVVLVSGFLALFFGLTLLIGYLVFRNLINAQLKRWLLGRKGYVEIEHISPTKVRSYFIMKPKESRFDVYDGFYHYIPETLTNGGDLLKRYKMMPDFKYLSLEEYGKLDEKKKKVYDKLLVDYEKELGERDKIGQIIGNLRFKPELTSWKFGMPIITYYGDNPDPIDFSSRGKTFGSGVIKDMYIRLLLTQRYKDFQMMFLFCVIAFVICAVGMIVLFFRFDSVTSISRTQLQSCLSMLNQSQGVIDNFIVVKAKVALQNSTLII